MRIVSFRATLAAAVLAALAVAVRPASAVNQYTLTDLGPGVAYAINASGQVVGGPPPGFNSGDAFVYSNGTKTDLGTLGGAWSVAYGINAAGQIVGQSETMFVNIDHAFLYSNRNMTDLGTVSGNQSSAYGINASGQIAGVNIPVGISGYAINNSGQTPAIMFNTFGFSGIAINDIGQVVGQNGNHAFLYSNGTVADLGTLGGSFSAAYAINVRGQIVGDAYVGGNAAEDAFLYDGGIMYDLNDLIASGTGWTITVARGINDKGWIAAYGYNPAVNGGNYEALLLTPTPEPTSLTILTLGVVGLMTRRRTYK